VTILNPQSIPTRRSVGDQGSTLELCQPYEDESLFAAFCAWLEVAMNVAQGVTNDSIQNKDILNRSDCLDPETYRFTKLPDGDSINSWFRRIGWGRHRRDLQTIWFMSIS
jgi:hypothetical protein